jgi:hypothetical protein
MRPVVQRRSCRLAMSIPIRVYAIDYQGRDFIEDTSTLVVNRHGAKIRLDHQLLPEQEIRLLDRSTQQEAIFRVVSKVQAANRDSSFWGVECLEADSNIWGIPFPPSLPADQSSVRVLLQCPICFSRELVFLDEFLVASLDSMGGISRGCLNCRTSALWTPVPFTQR